MAGLTAANYSLNLNASNNGKNGNNNGSNASSVASGNNGVCPPVLGENDPLPAGYVAFVRSRVAARNAAERARGFHGALGGGCGGRRKHCICSGLGCDDLWAQWVAAGCPDAPAGAAIEHPGVMGNEDDFGLAGNFENYNNNNNNNSNSRSENSFTKASRLEWEQIQREEEEKRKKRRSTRRHRANRRSSRRNRSNRRNRRTRSRR